MPETPIEPREPPSATGTPVAGLTTVRHAPRYRAFALTGVVLGLLVGAGGALLFGADRGAAGPAVVLVAVVCGVLGGWLGALVAVLLDRRGR